ncbi:hypothetical protein M0R45_030063 [Rubus argutus]|uniref:Uncharacterized protein n=1 Tax=Rubus argutus TaxID=59490 RepID=A0AAW1WBX1_RUBAR
MRVDCYRQLKLPAVSEVAIAAADSYLPVKGLQYLIDYIRTSTSLNCPLCAFRGSLLSKCVEFGEIMLGFLLFLGFGVVIMFGFVVVNVIYGFWDWLFTLMSPRLEELKQEMEDKDSWTHSHWLITFYTFWQLVELHEIVPGKHFDHYPNRSSIALDPN